MCKTVNSGAKTSLFRKCSTCVDAESCSEHVAVASTVAALRTVEQFIELWRLVRHAEPSVQGRLRHINDGANAP